MKNVKEWIAWRSAEDDRLYDLYGKPLEREHTGEFVAIGPTGETILGVDELTLTIQAVESFGPGRYAFRRIGYDFEGYIRGMGE